MSSCTGCLRPPLPEASQIGRCRAAGTHASRQTGYHAVCARHDQGRWVVSVRAAVAQPETSSAPASARVPPVTVTSSHMPATVQHLRCTACMVWECSPTSRAASKQVVPCACSSSGVRAGKLRRTMACTLPLQSASTRSMHVLVPLLGEQLRRRPSAPSRSPAEGFQRGCRSQIMRLYIHPSCSGSTPGARSKP